VLETAHPEGGAGGRLRVCWTITENRSKGSAKKNSLRKGRKEPSPMRDQMIKGGEKGSEAVDGESEGRSTPRYPREKERQSGIRRKFPSSEGGEKRKVARAHALGGGGGAFMTVFRASIQGAGGGE